MTQHYVPDEKNPQPDLPKTLKTRTKYKFRTLKLHRYPEIFDIVLKTPWLFYTYLHNLIKKTWLRLSNEWSVDGPSWNQSPQDFLLNLTCTRNKTVLLLVCWLRPNSQLAPMHESGWVCKRLPGISTSLWPMWVIVQGWHVRFNLWTPSPLWAIQNIIMR